jgi:SH3-like domain-containing protein
MRLSSRFASLLLCALLVPFATSLGSSQAAGPAQSLTLGPSGLPLPRFVSLKSGKVNLRIGPGLNYPVEWMYTKPGLPMEIVQEYDNWRRVRDAEGTEGWINQSLLSGKRTAIVSPWHRGKDALIPMRVSPDAEARIVAQLEPGVIAQLSTCNGEWCEVESGRVRGWVEQSQLWGAYPGERLSD